MNITINLVALLNALLLLSLFTSGGLLLHMEYKKRKSLKMLRAQWSAFPHVVREHLRSQNLFSKPLGSHTELYPKDVRTVITLIDGGNEFSALCFNEAGLQDLTSWSEGVGLDLTKALAKGVAEIEKSRPGLIPVLQVMLDEQRDKMTLHN